MRQSTTGRPHQVRKLHDPQILQRVVKGGKGADYPRPSRPFLRAAARRQLPAQTVSAVSDGCRTTNALAQNSPAGLGPGSCLPAPESTLLSAGRGRPRQGLASRAPPARPWRAAPHLHTHQPAPRAGVRPGQPSVLPESLCPSFSSRNRNQWLGSS